MTLKICFKIPLSESIARLEIFPRLSHFISLQTQNSSVIRQKGESQNGCFKKAKHAKVSEETLRTHVFIIACLTQTFLLVTQLFLQIQTK